MTPDTKIRIAILHQFGSIFKETNRGGDYKVRGFDSRPTLVTLPPKGTGGRQRTYNFIQAVTSLPPTSLMSTLPRSFKWCLSSSLASSSRFSLSFMTTIVIVVLSL